MHETHAASIIDSEMATTGMMRTRPRPRAGGSAVGGGFAPDRLCHLLKESEVEEQFGHLGRVTGEGLTTGITWQYAWRIGPAASEPHLKRVLWLSYPSAQRRGVPAATAYVDEREFRAATVADVPGLGDEAFLHTSGAELVFRAGEVVLRLELFCAGPGAEHVRYPAASDVAGRLGRLAQLVLERL